MQIVKSKFLGVLLLVVLAASSCVKNNGYADTINDPGQYVADISEAGAEDLVALALNSLPASEDVILCQVRIGSKAVPNKPFVIKLVPNPTLIADYNTAHGTSYVNLPSTAYTGSFDLTIPAGKRTADMVIKLNKTALDLSKAYAVGLSIASVDNNGIISSTAKNIVAAILVKNQYDGVYSIRGKVLRAGDDVLSGYFSGYEMSLITSGSNSVNFGGLQYWANGTGVGIGNPAFVINADNTITISSPGGAVNSSTQGSGYISRYDPAKKTFYADFVWGAGIAARRATDTLTYLRPR
jgi:Domain of unknown function (DUF1735)